MSVILLADVPVRTWLSNGDGRIQIVCQCGRDCQTYGECNIFVYVHELDGNHDDDEAHSWRSSCGGSHGLYKTPAQAKKAAEVHLYLMELRTALQNQIRTEGGV